jgi:hypothetical protein
MFQCRDRRCTLGFLPAQGLLNQNANSFTAAGWRILSLGPGIDARDELGR